MIRDDGYNTDECPRCQRASIGWAATSRTDNSTDICSRCGTAEAMELFLYGRVRTQDEWGTEEWEQVEEVLDKMDAAMQKAYRLVAEDNDD